MKNLCQGWLCPLILLGYILTGYNLALGADYKFFPSISLSEEYTDNVFASQNNRKADFITHASPGIALKYQASLWDWDLAYVLDYRYCAKNSRSDEFTHDLNAKGNLRLIDNFLYMDVSDTYKRVSLDVNRDTTVDTNFVNQADQNILTIAPHIEFTPVANLLVKSGYQYMKETYTSSSLGIDKEEQGAFISAAHELTSRMTITANFNYVHVTTGDQEDNDRLTPTLAVRYEYADKSFISLEGGYSWFLSEKTNSALPYWNAGIIHLFDFMTASLNALVKYNSDPLRNLTEERNFTAKLDRKLQRGSVGLFATYYEIHDILLDTLLSRKYEIGSNIRHELTEKLTGRLDVTGEKINVEDTVNLNDDVTAPYRFYISTGVSYMMANNLTASLDYRYTTYRKSIERAGDNTEINRIFLSLSKSF